MKTNINLHCLTIEEKALEQIKNIASKPWMKNADIHIMPDVHVGKDCVIGFVAEVHGEEIDPRIIGNDIGCGISVYKLGNKKSLSSIDYKALHDFLKENINSPIPLEQLDERVVTRVELIFEEISLLLPLYIEMNAWDSLGTLGGGNHFIEIAESLDGDLYLLVHSGSRSFGNYVYKEYIDIAQKFHTARKKNIREEIIEKLKREDRQHLIQETLNSIVEDKDNKYILDNNNFYRFIDDVTWLTDYAGHNRAMIIKRVCDFLGIGFEMMDIMHSHHNYLEFTGGSTIIRKGACSSKNDENVFIPINMRDGTLWCKGKGNRSWMYSAPHGAGRIMSRGKARHNIDLKDFKEQMKNVNTWCTTEDFLDEAPDAYKSLDEILSAIKDTVVIKDRLIPVFNYKSKEEKKYEK